MLGKHFMARFTRVTNMRVTPKRSSELEFRLKLNDPRIAR
jgi:hypothetical protein